MKPRTRSRASGIAAVAAAFALALSACVGILSSEPPGPLEGDWLLVRAEGPGNSLRVMDARISLVVDGESATGYAGCGTYAFRLAGGTAHLRLTENGDPPDHRLEQISCVPDLDEVQASYLDALRSSSRAVVTEHHLRLLGPRATLLFRAIPAPPRPRLPGTSWVLQSYGETWSRQHTTRLVSASRLSFIGDDRFLAQLACGNVVGVYKVVRSEITVLSYEFSGTEWCRRAATLQDLYLGELLNGFRASLSGDQLTLSRNRLEVTFRAASGELGPADFGGDSGGADWAIAPE